MASCVLPLQTLMVKVCGVILSVVGGLAVGKVKEEGRNCPIDLMQGGAGKQSSCRFPPHTPPTALVQLWHWMN